MAEVTAGQWLLVALSTAASAFVIRWLVLAPAERSFLTLRTWLSALIRRRFGGYEQQLNHVDESLPTASSEEKRVLVIGAGLAGIGAAANLAERGLSVTLRDASPHLGGKIGAWNATAEDGATLAVEHGFHAFFRHYYNLRRFLDRAGVSPHMTAIDDYMILAKSGRRWRFKDVETSPILNLVALSKGGLYRFRDILCGPALHKMDVFLKYDETDTFNELDETSYRQFAEEAALPDALRLVFNTFARAFFADEDKLSMAELVKSFHFFYLSHDHGLLYDYPNGDYQETVLAPIRRHLDDLGVTIELGRPVESIALCDGGLSVGTERFDYVVLATSPLGAQRIASRSPDLAAASPLLARRLRALSPSQRYAVTRLWLDRDIRADIPVFVATERHRLLDAVAACHRISRQAGQWAAERGGSVLELHCYAVPDDVAEGAVSRLLFDDLVSFFPELDGARVVHEHVQVNADFTAFHVGMARERPTTDTGIEGLFLAGDWVKTPLPAMLMEAAYSSGLLATNRILEREGLRTHPVYSVPRRGLLAGLGRRAPAPAAAWVKEATPAPSDVR